MGYDSKTRYEAISAIRGGCSLRQAAARAGVSHEAVRRWCESEGILFAAGPMGGAILPTGRRRGGAVRPRRLGMPERYAISMGLRAGHTYGAIADAIGFSASSVCREVSRHGGGGGGYDPFEAQLMAERASRRPKARKLDSSAGLRRYVASKLRLRWSPAQISAQLKIDFPDDEEMRVSHEAIYQAIYIQPKGALRQELKLEKALRSGRKGRVPRSRLAAKRGKDKSWVEGCGIALRPPEAEDRAVPGHWEGDLVLGGDLKSCLVTLVERSTRFALVRRLELHPSELVTAELEEMVRGIPADLLRSITWDQGVEMASHGRFTEATGVKVFFCDPHSPWQRGTNENTNGLIRDYFPKGTDFRKVTDREVLEMQDQLNGRPRMTLGWRKPAEAFAELLGKTA